jgi:hypothetical protein
MIMTQAFNGGNDRKFSISKTSAKRWQNVAICSLGFWLSGSLILDLVIMPTLWVTGMMESNGFASASYSIFWIFNRVELLCAAAIISSIWALSKMVRSSVDTKQLLAGSLMLMAIALSFTFVITPYMSGLGLDVDVFAPTQPLPVEMDILHSIYWVLEASKLGIVSMMMAQCYRLVD